MTIDENKIASLIFEEMSKKDIVDIIKKDKDIENKIKDIVSDVIIKLFKFLWQNNAYYKSNLK